METKTLMAAFAALLAVVIAGAVVYGFVVSPMMGSAPCGCEGGKCISSLEIVYVKPLMEESCKIEVKLLSYGAGTITVQLVSLNGSIVDEKTVAINGPRLVELRVPDQPGIYIVRALYEGKVIASKSFTLNLSYPVVSRFTCFYDGVKEMLILEAVVCNESNTTLFYNAAANVIVDNRSYYTVLVANELTESRANVIYVARMRMELEPGEHVVKVYVPPWKHSAEFGLLIPELKIISVKEVKAEPGNYEYSLIVRNEGPGAAKVIDAYAYSKVMGVQVMLKALSTSNAVVPEGGTAEIRVVFGGQVSEVWLAYEGVNATYVTKPFKLS